MGVHRRLARRSGNPKSAARHEDDDADDARAFAFRMPEIPEIPSMEWTENMLFGGGQPRLGIDAKISAVSWNIFGAPEAKDTRSRCESGSPAEKAGVKRAT